MITARAARVREHGGALGTACAGLEGTCDRLRRTEHGPFVWLRRVLRRLVRLVFEFLIVVVIALFELDKVRRRAASALTTRPR